MKLDDILGRIQSQSDDIRSLNSIPKPPLKSWTVQAALGEIDVLDYLRDADVREVALFKPSQSNLGSSLNSNNNSVTDNDNDINNSFNVVDDQFSSKLVRRPIEAPTPLRVKPKPGKEYSVEVLLNAADRLIDDYRPLPRTKQYISDLRSQLKEIEYKVESHQRVINSPLDGNNNTEDEQNNNDVDDSNSPQELIRIQTEEVMKMQAKVQALKKRKDILQATVKAQREPKPKPKPAPPTPIQLPLRQMREIQRKANTPRKPQLASVAREENVFDEDSFKMGDEPTLNQSTLLGNSIGDINLMPSTPNNDNNKDVLLDMNTPQYPPPPSQPQFMKDESIDDININIQRRPTPPSSPEYSPPTKLSKKSSVENVERILNNVKESPQTPKEKSPELMSTTTPIAPPPSHLSSTTPSEPIKQIETTPEIEAALNSIWKVFGETFKPKDEDLMQTPNLEQMLKILKNAFDSVPSQQHNLGSPTHSILSISSYPTSKESNNPQTALTAALFSLMLTTPGIKISMDESKTHLNSLAQSKGWPNELATKTIYGSVGKRVISIERKGTLGSLKFSVL